MATLTDIPARLTAGDSASWTIDDPEYSASAGWSMVYAFATGSEYRRLVSSASGTAHSFALTTAVSGAMSAGRWTWQRYAIRNSDRVTVASGVLEVAPNLDVAETGYDSRSPARTWLENLERWMRDPNSCSWVGELQIAGRVVKNIPIPDLLALLDRLRADVRREDQAAAIAAGRPAKNRLLVRFDR
jgi:hypothetical protein